MKLRPANTRSRLIESLLAGRSHARQEVLMGRASSPSIEDPDDDEPALELDELDAEEVLLEVEDDAELPAPLLESPPPPQAPTRAHTPNTMAPITAGRITNCADCMVPRCTAKYSKLCNFATTVLQLTCFLSSKQLWPASDRYLRPSARVFSSLRTGYLEYTANATPNALSPPGVLSKVTRAVHFPHLDFRLRQRAAVVAAVPSAGFECTVTGRDKQIARTSARTASVASTKHPFNTHTEEYIP